MSICEGIDGIIDKYLGITEIGTTAPHYRHRGSCTKLSNNPIQLDVQQLIAEILSRLEKNWNNAGCRKPSKENWRWDQKIDRSEHNKSKEKILEKAFVKFNSPNWWVNQVPTASGLVNGHNDKHRNIDLVRKIAEQEYEFIELKVGSNTPLHAAMEMLLYGALYIFVRRNYPTDLQTDKELLTARKVHLSVLAPQEYYQRCNLTWLVDAINEGLSRFLKDARFELAMDFKFKAFPDVYSAEYVTFVLQNIKDVCWSS